MFSVPRLFQNGMLDEETDLFVMKIGIQELDKIYECVEVKITSLFKIIRIIFDRKNSY